MVPGVPGPKHTKLPSSGAAPNLGNITRQLFCLLSVVYTNLPNKTEIKALRVSVPLLKAQRGWHASGSKSPPGHLQPQPAPRQTSQEGC